MFFCKGARRTIPAERGRWKTAAVNGQPIMADPAAYEIVPELAPRPDE